MTNKPLNARLRQMKHTLYLLPLLSLLLNSCASTLHKYFFAMGREGECVQLAEKNAIYRAADGKVYAQGYRTTFTPWPNDYMADIFHSPQYEKHIEPADETTPVWGEVKKTRKGWQRTDSPWLTSIPNPTRIPDSRLTKAGLTLMHAPHQAEDKTMFAEITTPLHPTAHALYAYPLGMITVFAIDTPATAIGSTAAVLGAAVTIPCIEISQQVESLWKGEER